MYNNNTTVNLKKRAHMNEIAELAEITKSKSVLYVEDDKDIRLNVTELLSNLFKEVSSAVDGLEGLKFYKENSFDYLITDIKMPKMNGVAMIEEILKINPKQLVVITTAHDEEDYLDKFKSMGVTHVLQKPITFDSLLTTLKDIVQ